MTVLRAHTENHGTCTECTQLPARDRAVASVVTELHYIHVQIGAAGHDLIDHIRLCVSGQKDRTAGVRGQNHDAAGILVARLVLISRPEDLDGPHSARDPITSPDQARLHIARAQIKIVTRVGRESLPFIKGRRNVRDSRP